MSVLSKVITLESTRRKLALLTILSYIAIC
jgi:hypothetical protein